MTVPLCRCRVLYIGSAVPLQSKDGLQGIQQPLRERYPINENTETKGIDSWLSVWSNGLLLEYIDGTKKTESAFFPIVTLHYCAAVRYVNVTGYAIEGGGERFIPLDTPFANIPDSPHPPIFAAIFRRTTGVKVLECHAFICTNERAANALVRCCFHAYADTIYLKMDEKIPGLKAIKESSRSVTPSTDQNFSEEQDNMIEEVPIPRDEIDWNERGIGHKTWQRRQQSGEYETASISSSLFKKSKKKSKAKSDGEPSRLETEGILVPYTEENGFRHRRSGSQADARSRSESAAGSHPPPPFGVPPMPFRPPPFGMRPPPPHMMPPPNMRPPPPHLAGRMPPPMFPMFPPHMIPPPHPFGRFPMFPPVPPYMMPPWMRPPASFMPPPPHMMDRPRTPTEGPIITGPESVYDTFPRRNYEEPIYMPSSHNGVPPHSSYKPGSMSPENYEGFYETYRQHRSPEKKNGSRSDSDASADESNQFWDQYEAGIYRRAHLNEKAFGSTLARTKTTPHDTSIEGRASTSASPRIARGDRATPAQRQETPVEAIRPETPPADYDLENLHLNEQHKNTTQRAAVF